MPNNVKFQALLPMPPWKGPPLPRYMKWSVVERQPLASPWLIGAVVIHGIFIEPITPEYILEAAKKAEITITNDEAKELLALLIK